MNIRKIYLSIASALILGTGVLFAAGVNHVPYPGSGGWYGSTYVFSTSEETEYLDLYIHVKTSGFGSDYSYYWYTQEVQPNDNINVADWYYYWCSDINNEVCYEYQDDSP